VHHVGFTILIYRVIQEESAILWELIVCVILSKKVHMNMGPILNGYRKRRYEPSCEHEQQLQHACRYSPLCYWWSPLGYWWSAMDKTLACRRLAHLITNFQRCRHPHNENSQLHLTQWLLYPAAARGWALSSVTTVVNYIYSTVFLTQLFTLATHGDSPFILRCMLC
jgi:hypothetical protein